MDVMDKTTKALATSLNFRKIRNDLIASNIANAETPHYKAKKIDFEDSLARAMDVDGEQSLSVTDSQHFDVGQGSINNLEPEIYENPNGVTSLDGNTVNRDQEMADLAENKIIYDASVQLLNKKLGMYKYAIMNER